MERIGLYGGTFNPPHLGHVYVARSAVDALGLDRLLIMPSCIPPHKEMPADSPTPAQRLELLRLAYGDVPKTEVSTLELDRGGISYTVDTVTQLKKQYPDGELILLLGTDMFLSFKNWRQWETILRNASLAVFCRGDKEEQQNIAVQKTALEALGATVYVMENDVKAISSTQLRRLMAIRCADPFLPEPVLRHILEADLYSVRADYRDLPLDKLETVVTGLLKPNRVAHVLGCRDTAAKLAQVWDADVTDAARAGLLHDITKALSGPLQLSLCRTYGVELDAFSSHNPKTLHALTGSLVAERIFGENPAVAAAIRSHTTGKADMNTLEKIIYVADYMEPNRDFPGVEELRRLAVTDLDKALEMGLEMTLALLREQGREISPESQQALQWLQNKK